MDKVQRGVDLYQRFYIYKGSENRELFSFLAGELNIVRGLYPGSFVHITPSLFIPSMVYVDSDKRAGEFFEHAAARVLSEQGAAPSEHCFSFLQADYTKGLELPENSFDLIISQYAGFVGEYTHPYLRNGGWLLVEDSFGDATLAFLNPLFELVGGIVQEKGSLRIEKEGLDECFRRPPRARKYSDAELKERILATSRPLSYQRSYPYYLFEKR